MINPVQFIDEGMEEEEDSDFQSGSEEDSQNENKIKKKYNEDEELIDDEAEDDGGVVTDSDNSAKNQEIQDDQDEQDEESQEEAQEHIHGVLDGENLIDVDADDYTEIDMDRINELLFCAQGIGKFTDDKKTVYEKARFCEPSMRDIHRFLRKDDPENPKCRNCMLTWKIAENDIIPLLLNYENNEKVQQLGLVLLVDLTESLPDILENRDKLESHLTDLQEFIANSNLIDLLSRSLADASAKLREASSMKTSLRQISLQFSQNAKNAQNAENSENEQNENKETIEDHKRKSDEIKRKIAEVEAKSQANIELIFVLLKQILNISSTSEIKKNVNNLIKILSKFAQFKIFDAIVFHSQSFNTEYYKRLSTTLLELVYSLIRSFTVNQIFEIAMLSSESSNNNVVSNAISYSQMSLIQRLKEEERQQKITRQSMLSSRPNNFGTTIKVSRPVDNSSFIVTNVNALYQNKEKLISDKMNEFTAQRKKPKRNTKPKAKGVLLSQAGEEIKLVNDLKVSENFFSSIDCSYKDMILAFKTFCEDFLSSCLNSLVMYFFEEIRLNEKIEKYDVYHLLGIMTFFLDFHRYKEHTLATEHKIKNKNLAYEFNAGFISQCISTEIIEFAFGYLKNFY
jgi:hypothetical protein